MASTLTRSIRRLTGSTDTPEYSPLLAQTGLDGRGRGDNNGGCPGQYESCFSPEDEQESEGAIYSAVRHRRHVDGSEQADGVTSRRSRDRRSQRAPVPAPRSRRNTKYSTLRACHSAGLTQAEFMERSRYARDPESGGPAPYNEDLYAPLPPPRSSGDSPDGVHSDIYESVQQHVRIIENIRLQPWPLAERKQYRQIMKSSLQEHVGQLDAFGSVNHSGHQAVSYASKKISRYATSHGFLSGWIKQIEGHFGTGVASFFVFVRALFFLNILTTLFAIGFLVVPQVAFGTGNKNVNSGDTLDKLYNSPVFYGYYDNDTSLNSSYNLPMAYLTVNLALFLLCFLSLAYVMRKRYRASKRTVVEKVECPFSVKLFTFWDYTITNAGTARVTTASIANGFKEELQEIKDASIRSHVSVWLLVILRLIVNLVIVSLLAGSGYVVYYFVRRDQNRTEFNSNKFLALVEQFELPFILAVLRLLGPLLFGYLVRLEKYPSRTAFKWTMSRTMVLYLGNLAVLTTSLLLKASRDQQCSNTNDDTPTVPVGTTVPAGRERDQCCWESMVGEEFLKVVIIDFGAVLLAVLFADVCREVVTRRNKFVREKIGRGEFQVAVSVLDMVYGQGLIWIGTFFSPILPAFAVAKTILLFFFHYYTTMFSHAAPKKIFRASRSGNFLLFVLQLTLFLCLLPILFVLSRLPPSANCGPFRSHNYSFGVITQYFSPSTVDGISLIGTPFVLIPLLIICCSAIVYYRLLAASYQEIIKDIRTQLHFDLTEAVTNTQDPVDKSGDNTTPTQTRDVVPRDGNRSRMSGDRVSTSTQMTTVSGGTAAARPGSTTSDMSVSNPLAPVAAPRGSRSGETARRSSSIVEAPLPEPPV